MQVTPLTAEIEFVCEVEDLVTLRTDHMVFMVLRCGDQIVRESFLLITTD